ncbi:hypothetical protein TAE01_00880 [Terrabacter aerolatus]|uniref:Uncharacterized protein n=2 Tax=Terrabacter aerolatus TaxID=422442 RepID=A0A512CVL1_9MICO|nr:hypothetical protein TAE01_00880 [Terrabacter aerolatus]
MWPRRSTSPGGPPPAALILADDFRVLQITMATIVIGLIAVAIAVGNAADWAPWAGIASAIVLVPAWLLLVVRAGRSRVEVSTGGVRVRRVFSTREIAPQDYDGVTWNPSIFPVQGASLAVRRKSGRPVSAPSAIGMLKNPLRTVEDEVAEIGEQVAAWLSGPPAGSHPYSSP